MTFDDATEAALQKLMEDAPAPTSEQAALITRIFATSPTAKQIDDAA